MHDNKLDGINGLFRTVHEFVVVVSTGQKHLKCKNKRPELI